MYPKTDYKEDSRWGGEVEVRVVEFKGVSDRVVNAAGGIRHGLGQVGDFVCSNRLLNVTDAVGSL